MGMVILETRLENNSPIPGLAVSFRKIVKLVLIDTGDYWHRHIAPDHFKGGARAEYGHKPRTPVYTSEIKPQEGTGRGRFVDNILSGRTRRFMLALVRITGTSSAVRIRMKVPRHVKRPFIGVFRKRNGMMGKITQQPDKARELVAMSRGDRRRLAEFASQVSLPRHIAENTKPSTKLIRG